MSKLKIVGGPHDGREYLLKSLSDIARIPLDDELKARIGMSKSELFQWNFDPAHYRVVDLSQMFTPAAETARFLKPGHWTDIAALQYLIDSHRTNNGIKLYRGASDR